MNEPNESRRARRETVRTWIVVALIAAYTLLYGFVVFRAVGDKGPPTWNFGTVDFTPAKSDYATAPAPRNLGQP